MQQRDFLGYGSNLPDPAWPNGARVAVSCVVNVEEGAELSIADGDERNEPVHEITDEVRDAPDPCRDSHYEYGTCAGYWRIMRTLETHGAPATLNACGRALERSPWLARDAVARGHEVACHGFAHRPAPAMDRATLAADSTRNEELLRPFLASGIPVSYAFPYGDISLRTKRFFARRYANARGVHPGINMGVADLADLRAISIECRSWDTARITRAIATAKANCG